MQSAGIRLQRIRQAQAVLDRLHEQLSGERVVRTSMRQYLDDWFDGKKAETVPSTMAFYRGSLAKFLQFLGKRSNDPMTEVTKQDVVAFRNSLITQVSAKTANHDLKALKMLFKSARRDGVVTEDPTEFVETVGREGDHHLFVTPLAIPIVAEDDDVALDVGAFKVAAGNRRLYRIFRMAMPWGNIPLTAYYVFPELTPDQALLARICSRARFQRLGFLRPAHIA